MNKCPHDSTELTAYDPELNADKAGRKFCAECGCSFRDKELATQGADCPALQTTPVPAVEEEVPAEEAEPEETEETPRRRGR